MIPKDLWRVGDQPSLVFHRVNPPRAQQNLAFPNLRERFPRGGTVILLIRSHGNAVRLDFNSFAGIIVSQEFSLPRIARQHRVRVVNEPARLQEESKDFPPVKTAV